MFRMPYFRPTRLAPERACRRHGTCSWREAGLERTLWVRQHPPDRLVIIMKFEVKPKIERGDAKLRDRAASALLTKASFLKRMREQLPTLEKVAVPSSGGVAFRVVMTMKPRYDGEACAALIRVAKKC